MANTLPLSLSGDSTASMTMKLPDWSSTSRRLTRFLPIMGAEDYRHRQPPLHSFACAVMMERDAGEGLLPHIVKN
jgi:hypothetical protein